MSWEVCRKCRGAQESDDEVMECNYAEVIRCNYAKNIKTATWILESGASHHMTGDLSKLKNVKALDTQPSINLPNGDTAMITHKGEIELTPRVKLKDIVYVPVFEHNLLSIHKLVRDNNLKIVFYPTYRIILCKETGKIQALGKAVKGLYYLLSQSAKEILKQREKAMQKENAKAMNASSNIQVPSVIEGVKPLSLTSLWHQRLGHAPLAKIKKIKKVESIRNLNHEKCVVCLQAKFTKLSYNRSNTRADNLFDLIHVDIWGPYRTPTRQHHRYFITVVDDFSRLIWIKLMRYKSEVFEALKEYVCMVKTQYERLVKVVRSDNALEFTEGSCIIFVKETGIVHQTSCVKRPQQNGRVERRHKNKLEMSRALRF
ncbi:Retrovirus-related Pol polyprotein from transposon RE1 [Bienertia sinuspersici]